MASADPSLFLDILRDLEISKIKRHIVDDSENEHLVMYQLMHFSSHTSTPRAGAAVLHNEQMW